MKIKTIVFTDVCKAELIESEIPDTPADHEIYLKTVHSTISAATLMSALSPETNPTTFLIFPVPAVIPRQV